MKTEDEHVPSYESLTDFQSAIASFKKRGLPAKDMIKLAIAINSPAESYARKVKDTLEGNSKYKLSVTLTPIKQPGTQTVEYWRIYALSKEISFGSIDEDEYFRLAGWVYSVSGYFNSTLLQFAFKL